MDLLLHQNMRHHLSRVQIKQLSIPANQTSINFDNVVTGALPNLVIVGPNKRCRSGKWLLEKPVQFPKFRREPHRAKAQWHVQAERGQYPEFHKRTVYKGLHDVPSRARVQYWRYMRESYSIRVSKKIHIIRV